jgi:hypothetical protein
MTPPHQDGRQPATFNLVGQKIERESRGLEEGSKIIGNAYPARQRAF